MAWYRTTRDERERSFRDKQRQRALLTAAGVAGVAGGLARAPWAAKHAVRAAGKVSPRVGRGVQRVSPTTRRRLRDIEDKATRASVPLAIASGATGSASSLIYAGRLKRETRAEGQKLGLVGKSAARGVLRGVQANPTEMARVTRLKHMRHGRRPVSEPGPARSADIAQGKLIRQQRLSQVGKAAKETPVSHEAWRASSGAGDDSWRSHVSPGAIKAHDEALPVYRRRHQRSQTVHTIGGMAGVGASGITAAEAARARTTKGKVGAGLAAAGLAGGSLVSMAHGMKSGDKRRGIERSQRKIRARGHQRRLDASA